LKICENIPLTLYNITPKEFCLLATTTIFPSLFERYNVSAIAFARSFQFIPWKTALQGNYFATLLPSKIFQEIYFVFLFPLFFSFGASK
jgi:hypothetical protein